MALKGYLAGIFRSKGAAVGGEEKHLLLLDSSFEVAGTGNGLSSAWTTSGTVTRVLGSRGGHGWYASLAASATVSQTVTLDAALSASAQAVARCWAKFTGGSHELTVEFWDAWDSLLSTETLTITGTIPYPVNGWGLYSMRVPAPTSTKKMVVTVTAGTGGVAVDDLELALMEQILGATGELTGNITVSTQDITTFATAQQDGGWRRHFPILHNGEQITVRTFWSVDDTYKITERNPVFVQLYDSVVDNTRWEFWAYVTGVTGRFPLDGVRETDLTITVTGDVGFADTVAS